jgi:hypothetical protein
MPTELPKTLEAFEVLVSRRRKSEEAARKIYLAEGGALLDKQIRHCEIVLDESMICRENEWRRLVANPAAMREKGERPMISVSEARLNINKIGQLIDQRNDLMLQARTKVNEAINGRAPQNEAEFDRAIEFAVAGLAEPQAAHSEEKVMRDPVTGEEMMELIDIDKHLEMYRSFTPAELEQYKKAMDAHDGEGMEKALARFPEEVRKTYAKIARAA